MGVDFYSTLGETIDRGAVGAEVVGCGEGFPLLLPRSPLPQWGGSGEKKQKMF